MLYSTFHFFFFFFGTGLQGMGLFVKPGNGIQNWKIEEHSNPSKAHHTTPQANKDHKKKKNLKTKLHKLLKASGQGRLPAGHWDQRMKTLKYAWKVRTYWKS